MGNEDGALKEGPLRSRVVDVIDELFRYTLLLRDQQPFLLQRYSERTAAAAKKNLAETSNTASSQLLQELKDPIIIDVRSDKEVKEAKGGETITGSYHVPLNVDGNPQSKHLTTAQEFYKKLLDAGVPMDDNKSQAFITHCTKGNTTDYIGRCARAAALLRNLGYINAHNGGSANEIRSAMV